MATCPPERWRRPAVPYVHVGSVDAWISRWMCTVLRFLWTLPEISWHAFPGGCAGAGKLVAAPSAPTSTKQPHHHSTAFGALIWSLGSFQPIFLLF